MNNSNGQTKDLLNERMERFSEDFGKLEQEVGKIIVGMQETVGFVLSAFFAKGHVLLEGVPGLGKTILVKSIASALGIEFKRVQFTPDLMPSDITGTQILSLNEDGARDFVFKPGPLFADIVLADEINRATSKTQSALLEAMEERQITVLDKTYPLSRSFFVLATQNPVEQEGTYQLPEAQLDRFMAKLLVGPPSSNELKEILQRTTSTDNPVISPIMDAQKVHERIEDMRHLVREVYVAEPLQEILVRMISALTPNSMFAPPQVQKYVQFGPGPRGAQAIMLMAKVTALRDNRINLAFEDIKQVLTVCLRHRLILNFRAEVDGVDADSIINEIKEAK